MLGRLKEGDEVKLEYLDENMETTRIQGTVGDQAGNYIRITVDDPPNHRNVTLETGTEYGPGVTVCTDFDMDDLGYLCFVTVANDDYKTVIRAK